MDLLTLYKNEDKFLSELQIPNSNSAQKDDNIGILFPDCSKVPREILQSCLLHCDLPTISRASSVCKSWNKVVKSNIFWKSLCSQRQPAARLLIPFEKKKNIDFIDWNLQYKVLHTRKNDNLADSATLKHYFMNLYIGIKSLHNICLQKSGLIRNDSIEWLNKASDIIVNSGLNNVVIQKDILIPKYSLFVQDVVDEFMTELAKKTWENNNFQIINVDTLIDAFEIAKIFLRNLFKILVPFDKLYLMESISAPSIKSIGYDAFNKIVFAPVKGKVAPLINDKLSDAQIMELNAIAYAIKDLPWMYAYLKPLPPLVPLYILVKSKNVKIVRFSVEAANVCSVLQAQLPKQVCYSYDIDDTPSEHIDAPTADEFSLGKIANYCNFYVKNSQNVEAMNLFETTFCMVDQGQLFGLITASHGLGAKPIVDVTCKKVADMIRGKSPEQIRTTFNIKNDFTAEEEEQIRAENAWTEDY